MVKTLPDKTSIRNWILLFSALSVVVYILSALKIDVMDIDSSHYAEMSREMTETGQYLEIKNRFVDDYLDKPPLIFWLSSVFFSIFGVSAFSFRIPAILASLLGAYSIYRFTRLHYDKETGLLAMLFLLSCQVYFLYNHNFLTDTLLANFTIFSIWQISEYLERKNWLYLAGAFIGMGGAMLSKGPLGLMVVVSALAVHFAYKKQWRNFFRWEWLVGILIILVVLLPMMIGLYRQFGNLGLQFFFWTQSFGRITGQSHWHDQSSPFFFVHTFLWFFLPWSILGIYGLGRNLKTMIFKGRNHEKREMMTTGGFVLTFLALSLSQYKLPQYIFVLMPLAAVISADAVIQMIKNDHHRRLFNWISGIHYFISGIYWIAALMIVFFVFPEGNAAGVIILLASMAIFGYLVYSKSTRRYKIILPVAAIAICANLVLAVHFYPQLLHYQTGQRVAERVQEKRINVEHDLYLFQYHSPALDFHLNYPPPIINEQKLGRMALRKESMWIITDQQGRQNLDPNLISEAIAFDQYPIQLLTLNFLNPKKRADVLREVYLIKVKDK